MPKSDLAAGLGSVAYFTQRAAFGGIASYPIMEGHMKRILWTLGMFGVMLAGFTASPTATTAAVSEACWEIECNRDLNCGISCPSCNGEVWEPGECWYDQN